MQTEKKRLASFLQYFPLCRLQERAAPVGAGLPGPADTPSDLTAGHGGAGGEEPDSSRPSQTSGTRDKGSQPARALLSVPAWG